MMCHCSPAVVTHVPFWLVMLITGQAVHVCVGGSRDLHLAWVLLTPGPLTPASPVGVGGRTGPSSQGPWSSLWGNVLWMRWAGFESRHLH